MSALRVVFMGTPGFAVAALESIIASPHEVVGVYTQPPRPAGRGQKLTPSLVHQLADRHNIPVFTPESLKSAEAQTKFAALKADIGVVAAYGLLLPQPILDAPKFGCINIHPSALPRWRGAAPIQRTVMAGDTTSECCIMQMDAGLDTGAVLARESVKLNDMMHAGMLHDMMADLGARMTVEVLNQFASPTRPKAIPQTEDGATYAKKLTKADQTIDWSKPAKQIVNQIRGLAPTPGATTMLNGELIKIFQASIEAGAQKAPGTAVDEKLLIQCGDGHALRILELQRPNKSRMAASEALKSLIVQKDTIAS